MDTIKRNYLLNLLKESEAELLSFIQKLDEAAFLSKPTEDAWSVAELVEHIMITDTSLLQGIKKKGENIPDTTPETMSNEEILKFVPNRNKKVTAPSFLVPKGRFTSKTQAIAAFRKNRAIVEHFVKTTDWPLERIAFKHFIFGLINGEGWIVFMVAHCQRHLEQMKA